MNKDDFFRFSCDTNVLIAASFYYRFKFIKKPFCEEQYENCILIMRYFEKVLYSLGKKFGILTQSVNREVRQRIVYILIRNLSDKYQKNKEIFKKIVDELSSILNRINDNLNRNLKIFIIGKANIKDKRVQKVYLKVNEMYNKFSEQAIKIIEQERKKSWKDIGSLVTKRFRKQEIFSLIQRQELEEKRQILNLLNKPVGIKDKEILSEIIYERKRVIQENPKLKGNLIFFFVSEDVHFSPKYIKRYDKYSNPVTEKIKELFDITCIRSKNFCKLIKNKKLNLTN